MRLAVLTTGRQDWGILRSVVQALSRHPRFDVLLLVGGMGLDPAHGQLDRRLESEGFSIAARLPWEIHAPAWQQSAEATRLVGNALDTLRPEALILLGDRFETAAAALAAVVTRTPLVHLHGGEETLGAIDNALRHAITKQSHLHLVSHPLHARRIAEMGEDPSTIHVVGAPGLDNLHRTDLPDRATLEESLGIRLTAPVVVVTHHPATLGADAEAEARAVVAAMDTVDATYVITLPNADPGGLSIRQVLIDAAQQPRRVAVDALGEQRFWGMLRIADAMLGNSSSALIEAPAAGVPAVNVGDRQRGRLRGANVIEAAGDSASIAAALRHVLDPAFRASIRHVPGPFGDGHAADRIVDILERWTPPQPPVKAHHAPAPEGSTP